MRRVSHKPFFKLRSQSPFITYVEQCVAVRMPRTRSLMMRPQSLIIIVKAFELEVYQYASRKVVIPKFLNYIVFGQ